MSKCSTTKSSEKLFLLLIIFLALLFSTNVVREGFSVAYKTCVKSGFTKEFCSQTPTSAMGPSGCECPMGGIGYRMLGWRSKCICNNPIYPSGHINPSSHNNPNPINNYFNQFFDPSDDYPFKLIEN